MQLEFVLGVVLMALTVAPAIVVSRQPMDSREDNLDDSLETAADSRRSAHS